MKTLKKILIVSSLLLSGIANAQLPATEVTDKNLIFGHGKYLQINSADNTHSIKIIQSGATPTLTTDTGALVVTNGISGTVVGAVTGAVNGSIGATTPNTGAFTTVTASGTIKSTAATGVGAHKLSGANVACNTTCTSGGCLFGFDLAGGAAAPVLVECASATADTCLCLQ